MLDKLRGIHDAVHRIVLCILSAQIVILIRLSYEHDLKVLRILLEIAEVSAASVSGSCGKNYVRGLYFSLFLWN